MVSPQESREIYSSVQESTFSKPDPVSVILTHAAGLLYSDNPTILLKKQVPSSTGYEYEAQSISILLFRQAGISSRKIGELFSLREATVRDKIRSVKKLITSNDPLRDQINRVKNNLPWIRTQEDRKKTVKQIKKMLSVYPGVGWKNILGKSKTPEVNFKARFIAMHLLRTSGFTEPEVGKLLRRDHSTVENGLNRLIQKRKEDRVLDNAVEIMEDNLDAIVRRRELEASIDRVIAARKTQQEVTDSFQAPLPL